MRNTTIRGLPLLRRTAALIAVALGASLLTAGPAEAAAINHPMVHTAGHTCLPTVHDQEFNTAVMCIDIGVYTSSSGASFVTAQASALCKDSTGATSTCLGMTMFAEIAHGSGDPQSGDMSCQPCLQQARNYFYPYGGFPISSGHPVFNVWGVLLAASEIDMPDGFSSVFPPGSPPQNFGTPHFNVSMDPAGNVSFSRV